MVSAYKTSEELTKLLKEEMTEDAFRTVKELNVSEYPLQLDYLFATDEEREMKNVKLRKIIGWILVFTPLLLVTVGERYFPTDISIMVMRILMALGLLSISVVGTCLISNELPIRIIVEKDEEGER